MFRRLDRITLSLCTALLLAGGGYITTASLAHAQDDDAAAAATHKSNKGYSIDAPGGWEKVAGELDAQELEKLPTNIREHYDPKTTDVMFMDLESTKDNEFKDNLNVVVLDEPVPFNDELLGELEGILTDQYSSLFENFKLGSFEKKTFGANEAIAIEATYTLLGYNLVLYQALMSGDSKALVVTCTIDQARKDARQTICDSAFGSIKFE